MNFTWLDHFCNSTFWNSSVSWNTNQPDLTECFEKTVFTWVPCMFLWIFSSMEIYYYMNSKTRRIQWNWLNITKLTLIVLICSLISIRYILDISSKLSNNEEHLSNLHIYGPIIELISFMLALFHTEMNRRMGLRTSGTLFIFWFLNTIFGAIQTYSIVRVWNSTTYYAKSYILQFGMTCVIFILSCCADYPPTFYNYVKSKKPSPVDESSFLSRILFSYFTRMAWKGYKNPLDGSELWDLRVDDMSKNIVPIFNKHWETTLMKNKGKKPSSILPVIFRTFGLINLTGSFCKLLQDTLLFVSPTVLKWLIDFIKNDEETWKGFLYAGILFVTCSTQTILLSQYFYRMSIICVQVRTSLISAIYRKALKVSAFSRKDSTAGEIVNLMAVDTQKFVETSGYFNLIWSAPYQIIVALLLLWNTMGVAVLSGVTLMIILIPVNMLIISKVKKFQIKQMKYKDERIKVTNEVFSGIKILKLYAWEPTFENLIHRIRAKELYEMKKAAFVNAGSNFIWGCTPFLVSLVTFATYVLIDENNVLDAQTAFVALSLFNILRFPMGALPLVISNLAQVLVSVKRINKFLNLPELNPANVSHDASEDSPLLIEGGTFTWGNEPILKDIDIKLSKCSLTAIVGHVGAGKSSLISAFLGEMEKKKGRVNTIGTISYVSQQAWIQNATLRNNILFGHKYNKTLYDNVIEACALKEDLMMLPGGDRTEIGDKGINLSGGQKQRVNLARAVYANRDIYLFDDPLSAVDCHVAAHLFEKVIGPNGLLKNKTRVLATHHITFLPHVDQIMVLKNGCVSERGTYQELLNSKGAFAEFLEQHTKSDVNEEGDVNPTYQSDSDKDNEFLQENNGQERMSKNFSRSSIRSDGTIPRLSCQTIDSDHNIGQLTEVERMETGNVSFQVYKQYIKSIGPILCIFILLFDATYQGFGVSSNFWLSKWSNDASAKIPSKRNEYLEVYGLLGFGQGLSSFLLSFAFAQGFYQSSVRAHQMLMKSCLRALQSFFDTTPLGRILNRFSNDMNCVDITLPNTIYQAVVTLFTLAGTLFVISYNSPVFLIVIVLTGIVYILIQRVYQATCRQLKRLESVSRSPIFSFFGETLSGTSTIRAFVQQERFITEIDKRVDDNQVYFFYGQVANRWLAVRLESLANLIILFAALFAVLGRKSLNPGIVGLSVSYALQITQSLNWLVRMVCDVETNIVSVERIKEYSEAPQEAQWEIPETKPNDSWPETGSVSFEEYSVRYRPGLDLVLKDVTFSIKGGEKVGIVGRTGAGKSSLTLCLFRIIEAAGGSIYIDGVDISKMGLHSLRSRITIIPQDAILFSGTLRMNLDPYNKYSDEELWKSLEHANLKEFISDCPNGLLCEVTESGENFSVGQRQLICLSRALLRKTKLLILDEATAAVDLHTDDLIQKTIRTQFSDCTIITIAHRLNTVMDYDKIMVLDKGYIKEFDTPQNLIEQRNVFYNMCKEAKTI